MASCPTFSRLNTQSLPVFKAELAALFTGGLHYYYFLHTLFYFLVVSIKTNLPIHSRYTFEVAPAFTLIELKLINHILKLFGIPDGDGIFSPGGSMSMLYAVVAARYNAFPEVKQKGLWNLPKMMLFTSEDVSLKLILYVRM